MFHGTVQAQSQPQTIAATNGPTLRSWDTVSRVYAVDAGQCDLLSGSSGDDSGRPRSVRTNSNAERAITQAWTAVGVN
jgi:hypothetical protein